MQFFLPTGHFHTLRDNNATTTGTYTPPLVKCNFQLNHAFPTLPPWYQLQLTPITPPAIWCHHCQWQQMVGRAASGNGLTTKMVRFSPLLRADFGDEISGDSGTKPSALESPSLAYNMNVCNHTIFRWKWAWNSSAAHFNTRQSCGGNQQNN